MFLKRLFDLSLRHKLPLWGSLLIICTALAVAAGHLYQAMGDVEDTMLDQSESLGWSMQAPLLIALMRNDKEAAYALIQNTLSPQASRQGFQIEQIIVLNESQEIFAATGAQRYLPQTGLAALGPEFRTLSARLVASRSVYQGVIVEGPKILLALPIERDGVIRGHLVLVHSAGFRMAGFIALVRNTLWTILLALAVVLPISWYWGRRMAVPLIRLAGQMGNIGHRPPEPFPSGLYSYEDEVGQLFRAYNRMCLELREKESMRQEMIQSERLAALGRLSASVAHEINNPLAGLVTAVDTLKQYGCHDPVAHRVLPLLERGLEQIKGIVGALLVESRAKSHSLSIRDIEDVQTLLATELEEHRARWEWDVGVHGEVPLPATLVRQILINLLLNAVQAAGPGGHVKVVIKLKAGHLSIGVVNDGRQIPAELKCRLFEPFTGTREGGQGLGLWVTYQIVQQLGGRIKVLGREGRTCFLVRLPLRDRQ